MLNIQNKNVNEDLKEYEDNFFNIIFSDPPYNLGSKTYIDSDGKFKFKGQAQDFMNKWFFGHEDWEIFFEESFRTLKYGGFCILYGMDRQQPLIQYYAVKAGFEVQQSLYWYFISSFPKSTDVGKMIDKREGAERKVMDKIDLGYKDKNTSPLNIDDGWNNNNMKGVIDITKASSNLSKKYDGYKYSICPLKQTVEVIMVFRKPTKNKSVLDDVYAYEDGDKEIHPAVINIEGGRVPSGNDEYDIRHYTKEDCFQNKEPKKSQFQVKEKNSKGRYPSQLFLDEYCADRIDMQSGESSKSNFKIGGKDRSNIGFKLTQGNEDRSNAIMNFGDSGGASRINHIIPWTEEEMDLLYYEPKVSGKERNAGLDKLEDSIMARSGGAQQAEKEGKEEYLENHIGMNVIHKVKNNHPTLKSLFLNFKIFELFAVPDLEDMKVYVPFAGTFSEVIGVLANGVKEESIYACELSEDYIEIGKARLDFWKKKKFDFKNLKVTKAKSKEKEKKETPVLF